MTTRELIRATFHALAQSDHWGELGACALHWAYKSIAPLVAEGTLPDFKDKEEMKTRLIKELTDVIKKIPGDTMLERFLLRVSADLSNALIDSIWGQLSSSMIASVKFRSDRKFSPLYGAALDALAVA